MSIVLVILPAQPRSPPPRKMLQSRWVMCTVGVLAVDDVGVVANLGAVEPDRQLAVGGADGVHGVAHLDLVPLAGDERLVPADVVAPLVGLARVVEVGDTHVGRTGPAVGLRAEPHHAAGPAILDRTTTGRGARGRARSDTQQTRELAAEGPVEVGWRTGRGRRCTPCRTSRRAWTPGQRRDCRSGCREWCPCPVSSAGRGRCHW